MIDGTVIEQILDLARWAPSGDNSQPWRFEAIDDSHVVVHGFDTREHCVYDLDGRPSQVSLGALLETLSIAASGHGLRMQAERRANWPDCTPTYDLRFDLTADRPVDPLIAAIPVRCVQRRPMSLRALTQQQKQALEHAVAPDYRIIWFEGIHDKLRIALLMFHNAKLRLTLPEAYPTHRAIIQWNSRTSEDRIPDQALGIDPITARLMRFALGSWRRVEFLNRFLAGTWMPRLQMDLMPGMACAAHFVIQAQREAHTTDDFVAAGRAVQRCWLTATTLGLFQQPEMTPLIFARYVRNGIGFTAQRGLQQFADELEAATSSLIGPEVAHAVWMGRLGAGATPTARSTRHPLAQLMRKTDHAG